MLQSGCTKKAKILMGPSIYVLLVMYKKCLPVETSQWSMTHENSMIGVFQLRICPHKYLQFCSTCDELFTHVASFYL